MSVADQLQPLVAELIGDARVHLEFWDGSTLGPDNAKGTIIIHTPEALRRIVWAPNELGPGRAYVAGEIDFEGDVFALVEALKPAGVHLRSAARSLPTLLRTAAHVGALGRPPAPPAEEAHQHGLRHSKERDASAINHHYDVGNAFYEIVLGPAMTYSCARFTEPRMNLAEAQRPSTT